MAVVSFATAQQRERGRDDGHPLWIRPRALLPLYLSPRLDASRCRRAAPLVLSTRFLLILKEFFSKQRQEKKTLAPDIFGLERVSQQLR